MSQSDQPISREDVESIYSYGPWNDTTKNYLGQRVCYHCDFLEPDHAGHCAWQLACALLAQDDALDKIEDLASSGRATVMAEIVAIAGAAMLPQGLDNAT